MGPDALLATTTRYTTTKRRQLTRNHTTLRGQTSAAQIYKSSCNGFSCARATSGGQLKRRPAARTLYQNLTRILKPATHVSAKKSRSVAAARLNCNKSAKPLLRIRRIEPLPFPRRFCCGY